MICVLDTSAAASIALLRPECELPANALADAELVLAPQLIVAELTNVFWKYHHLFDMPLSECQAALADSVALADLLVEHVELHREAFAIACQTGRPAYDAFFLALARRNDATLITVDAKLASTARKLDVKRVLGK